MLNDILKEIDKYDLDQLREVVEKIENKRKFLINKGWEVHYQKICNNKYLNLSDVFISFSLEISDSNDYEKIKLLKDFCYKRYKLVSISEIIEKADKLNLPIGGTFAQMICEACCCEKCNNYNDCHHKCTCKECKKNNYNDYEWSCEE